MSGQGSTAVAYQAADDRLIREAIQQQGRQLGEVLRALGEQTAALIALGERLERLEARIDSIAEALGVIE